ncbi:hypothetical protein J8281_12540 [Aquimarina sp. U1-2]|uniref:hypothetical protein n=1 Tax=Aquimarina sp. U1-2 TaxID=2823141 RepID=UPI001AEC7797|nr:hypothetical protein [Aquimarina sp. U1-2]MBP2833017.1 hypothetical protein [Aquimarina sp. U1-2]
MGLGAGHIVDMINRMKDNRALRSSNRSTFKENNGGKIYSKDRQSPKPYFRTIPEKKVLEIKDQTGKREV